MISFSSTRFISVAASGADWREASKAVLDALNGIRTGPDDGMNVAFLYVSDLLSDDVSSILNLFRSITKIPHWIGCVGMGVCAPGEALFDEPAISVLIGRFPEESFHVVQGHLASSPTLPSSLEEWLKKKTPFLSVVHGDPAPDSDMQTDVRTFGDITNSFLVGGVSSSREETIQIAEELEQWGLSGIVFDDSIPVITCLSQGCAPIGPFHTISRCDGPVIMELDRRPSMQSFTDDLKALAMESLEPLGTAGSVAAVTVAEAPYPADMDMDTEPLSDPVQDRLQNVFRGEIHAALPIPESDGSDYLVRNILNIDVESGWMAIAHDCSEDEQVRFVQRNADTMEQGLQDMLEKLRNMAIRQTGKFAPVGALYFSCAARAQDLLGNGKRSEMEMIQEVLGDIPLAGVYAGGEIFNRHIHGYTGILTLFL